MVFNQGKDVALYRDFMNGSKLWVKLFKFANGCLCSLCGIATSFLHRVQLLVAIQLLFEVSRKADCYIDTIPVFNIKRGLIRK